MTLKLLLILANAKFLNYLNIYEQVALEDMNKDKDTPLLSSDLL